MSMNFLAGKVPVPTPRGGKKIAPRGPGRHSGPPKKAVPNNHAKRRGTSLWRPRPK